MIKCTSSYWNVKMQFFFLLLRVARHEKCQLSQFPKPCLTASCTSCCLRCFSPCVVQRRVGHGSALPWGSAARGAGAVHGAEPQRGAGAVGRPGGEMGSAILPPAKEAHSFTECETGFLVIYSSLLHVPDLLWEFLALACPLLARMMFFWK